MYKKKAHLHFVGIGGIGMSGIAKILKFQGYKISGCDLDTNQKSIEDLKAIGCQIYHGNNTLACRNNDIDIVVYSSAIRPNDPEIVAAQKRGIPTIPRAIMLAELMRTKYSIAIAGSHGKTTTTSLISHILIETHMDPTVIIGGHLQNISTNALLGHGDFLVAEADESDRSLIQLQATLAVVTNIDLEHLETYKNLADVKDTFKIFLNNLPFYGKAFMCIDDPNIQSILPIPHIKIIKYGIEHPDADIYGNNIVLHPNSSTFTVFKKNLTQSLGNIIINMPGKHNVQNCLAAVAVALDLGISFEKIAQAIKNFKGIDRRFCYKGLYKGAELFDDYGHHPKEIRNTLEIAKRRSKGKLIVVFQPHRYTRTHKLWDDFVTTFSGSAVDHLLITDIYSASEDPIAHVNSQRLVSTIKKNNPHLSVTYVPYEDNFSEIKRHIEKIVEEQDLILSLGAGKVTHLANKLT